MPLDGTSLTENAQILLQASQEIRKGWCQGSDGAWDSPEGAVCALGAIARVCGGTSGAFYTASMYLRILVGDIPEWNDHPSRTAEQVANVMEKLAFEEGI